MDKQQLLCYSLFNIAILKCILDKKKKLKKNFELTSAALSAALFRPQPSFAQRSAVLRSLVIKKLSKKMSEDMDQSSSPTALNGVILKGCRSSKKAGLAIFRGFQTP